MGRGCTRGSLKYIENISSLSCFIKRDFYRMHWLYGGPPTTCQENKTTSVWYRHGKSWLAIGFYIAPCPLDSHSILSFPVYSFPLWLKSKTMFARWTTTNNKQNGPLQSLEPRSDYSRLYPPMVLGPAPPTPQNLPDCTRLTELLGTKNSWEIDKYLGLVWQEFFAFQKIEIGLCY